MQPLLEWLALHPAWAGLAIFSVALLESLVVVGIVVPGAALMLGVGALIALDVLELWPSLAWAVAGAVAGDGISFWVGRHYKQHLRNMGPFRRYPRLIERGEAFFLRHGGKSIAFGRFVGPVRAIIPTVAGMMGMAPGRFAAVNVASAFAWAPAYILPGMVFTASLGLAAEVSTRLLVLLVVTLVLLWLSLWIVRRVFLFVGPRAGVLLARLLAWTRLHPVMGGVLAAVIDPKHPEARGLAIFAGILLFAGLAFFTILGAIVSGTPLAGLDGRVFRLLQGLRTPWADQIMVPLTELGDTPVNTALVLAVLGWLAWRRNWLAAGHWLAAALFAMILIPLLKAVTRVPRPVSLPEVVTSYSFPSGHATAVMVLYGFLAVLVAREVRLTRRWIPYAAAALIVVPIALSRLYLGVHWLSDVMGGLTLGLAWVALLGIAYQRHSSPPATARGLALTALLTLAAVGGWHVARHYDRDVQYYAVQRTVERIDAQTWWEHDWGRLAAYRVDLGGEPEEPMTVQWAGPLGHLQTQLAAHGWQTPIALKPASVLSWLAPEPPLAQLPVVPHLHDGRREALFLVRATDRPDTRLLLRLWPTDTVLQPEEEALWIGNVSYERLKERRFMLSLPVTLPDLNTPLGQLRGALGALSWKRVRHSPPAAVEAGDAAVQWNGDVLLIRGGESCSAARARLRGPGC